MKRIDLKETVTFEELKNLYDGAVLTEEDASCLEWAMPDDCEIEELEGSGIFMVGQELNGDLFRYELKKHVIKNESEKFYFYA